MTLRLESGALVEGFVDLAFEVGGQMVVVDFKTDRELEGALETYRRQVQIYAHAIAAATGRTTRGVLMKILAPTDKSASSDRLPASTDTASRSIRTRSTP